MAKQMSFTELSGTVNTLGYWIPNININRSDKTGKVVFLGFINQVNRDAKNVHTASKTYIVDTTIFDKYFATAVLNAINVNIYDRAYALADATYDGPIKTGYTLEDDGTYTRDSDSATVPASEAVETFFENGTDV